MKSTFSIALSSLLFAFQVASANTMQDIDPHGHARFVMGSAERPIGWVVRCNRPMRDCSARTTYAVVRVLDGQATLSFFSSTDSAPLVLTNDASESWSQARLGKLTTMDIDVLNDLETFVVLSGRRGPETLASLNGLTEVIDYLSWLQSDVARAIRDASLWSNEGGLDVTALESVALFRYNELIRRRRLDVPSVPPMKPTISPM